MNCQTRGCPDIATTTVTLNGADRGVCGWHATVAHIWIITSAPDTDTRPHTQRGCALPGCEHRRALGRAVCTDHAGEDTPA